MNRKTFPSRKSAYKIVHALFMPLAFVLLYNVTYSEDLFPKIITGTYHHSDSEIRLTISANGTFTIFNKSTNVSISGSWQVNDKEEIIFTSPYWSKSNPYQIYGKHLFQNGYLVWRKIE